MRFAIALLLASAATSWSQDWHEWLARGMEFSQRAQYVEAAEALQKAVALAPDEVKPHLYLGAAWLGQYIPGTNYSLDFGRKAEAEFREVLRIEPDNATAIAAVASLKYQEALGEQDAAQKLQKLKEASSWYDRAIGVNPQNKNAYYSRAVIAWGIWYPAWSVARGQIGMAPSDPGPLTDPAVRKQLKERYSPILDQAVADLETALKLDPAYDDAMAYMNLFVRERADLDDTPEQYRSDIQVAHRWAEKALDTKKTKAPHTAPVARVRVSGNLQVANLIRKVDPVYPTETDIRKNGTVHLTVIIGVDGRVQNLHLISGNPLLVKAAMDAVRQWEYEPTFLNGQPVEIETEVEVNFARP